MKQILVLNSGSSTLKYQLIDMDNETVLSSGNIECIGEGTARAKHEVNGAKHTDMARVVDDHAAAFQEILEFFDTFGPKLDAKNLMAVGHRVAHGGAKFDRAMLIGDTVEKEIEALAPLAPLHNPAALKGIHTAKQLFPDVPHVAVFDTAFHQTLPPENYTYAIDNALAEKYGIRRYGFHGTSHKYVTEAAARFLKKPLDKINLITLHLGSGSSVAAIRGGKSVDTSMGMTPLAGLVMNTRVGDIDPSVVFYLYREAGMRLDKIDELFNRRSGLYGLNNGSTDMRDIMDTYDSGDKTARRAMDIYVKRIHDYLGAYYVELGHVDALVLTAGVGENNGPARRVILHGLDESLGIKIDEALNMQNGGFVIGSRQISTPDSRIPVLVIQTNEELSIGLLACEAVTTEYNAVSEASKSALLLK